MKKILLSLSLAVVGSLLALAVASAATNDSYSVVISNVAVSVLSNQSPNNVASVCVMINGAGCYAVWGQTNQPATTSNALLPDGWSYCWIAPNETPPKFISLLPISGTATSKVWRTKK